jgi:hypothetical protein
VTSRTGDDAFYLFLQKQQIGKMKPRDYGLKKKKKKVVSVNVRKFHDLAITVATTGHEHHTRVQDRAGHRAWHREIGYLLV